uniref:VHS domain-containing protein n=1 Tax=Trichobilharzia regenti TaxID=157069 RepID=A0AA85IY16_TRIRE|nr:unnamed protein product [Trichobilharzia regenti]
MNELEKLLSKATNPVSDQYNSDTVNEIAKLIDTQPNGPVFTLRLLAHKIKSPHEREALSSLALLESLSKRCSPTFISELGKFKFLNELIKVLSPKYLGDQTATSVKNKCAQLLHNWQRDYSTSEPKFAEAYNMLVREGIITAEQITTNGPNSKVGHTASSTAEERQNIFERNKKSERLTQLLRSRNPADLREANALIKSIVEEDQVRMEKVSQRTSEMEALRNNTILLEEMISTYMLGESTEAELELMSELVENIRKARPLLYSFSLTHEEQDMETLTEIGRICDRASEVISNYEQKVTGGKRDHVKSTPPSSSASSASSTPVKNSSQSSSPSKNEINDAASSSSSSTTSGGSSRIPDLLTQDLMNLGLDDPIKPSSLTVSSADVLMLLSTSSSSSNNNISLSPTVVSGTNGSSTGGGVGVGGANQLIPSSTNQISLITTNNNHNHNRGHKSNYEDLEDIFSTLSSNNNISTNVTSVSSTLYPTIFNSVQTKPSKLEASSSSSSSSCTGRGQTANSNSKVFSELDNLSRQMLQLSKTNALADTNLSRLLGNESAASCTTTTATILPTKSLTPTNHHVVIDSVCHNSDDIMTPPHNPINNKKNNDNSSSRNLVNEAKTNPVHHLPKPDNNDDVSLNQGHKNSGSIDLKSINIQLSSILPHPVYSTPVILYPVHCHRDADDNDDDGNVGDADNFHIDKNNSIQLALHYAQNRPHPEVMVFVAVISSQNSLPITEINPCRIRQLSASGQNLPAYSPFLPSASISQIVLIHNPSNLEKFVLKFQFSFVLDGEAILESGNSIYLLHNHTVPPHLSFHFLCVCVCVRARACVSVLDC